MQVSFGLIKINLGAGAQVTASWWKVIIESQRVKPNTLISKESLDLMITP